MIFDIWSILILIVIFQGVFLLSLFFFSKKKRGNVFLIGLAIVVLWYLAEFLAIRNVYQVGIDAFYGTRFGSWLVLGPLAYFYIKSVTNAKWEFTRKDLLHFLPFVLFWLIIPLFSSESLSHRQVTYGMLSVFDFRKKVVTPFEYLYSVIFFLQFCHLFAYLLLNLKQIKSYQQNLKQQYAQLAHIKWLKAFVLLMVSILVLASLYLYLLFETQLYKRVLDYIYVLPMGILIYAISYRLAGIEWLSVEAPEPKYLNSSLQASDQAQIVARLSTLMETEKPYLENELRIKGLSEKLEVTSHHLSQVINDHFGRSFFDFVNSYRVAEAKQLIAAHPDHTLLRIAFDAGFNNKTSFVNAFKKIEGMTPSAYRKRLIEAV